MNLLSELSTQVLIGVERRQPTLPAAPGLLGELLSDIANATPATETQVLRAAGAIGICALAGYSPSLSEEAEIAICPAETRRIPTPRSLRPMASSSLPMRQRRRMARCRTAIRCMSCRRH